MTPLSAQTYLEAYLGHDKSKDVQTSEVLEKLQKRDLIPVAVFEDAWPDEGWEEPINLQDPRSEDCLTIDSENFQDKLDDGIASLRDQAMDQLIGALIDDPGSNTPILLEADHLTDLGPRLKPKLYERAESLKPSPALVQLLTLTLKRCAYVDLAPFKKFAVDELAELISGIASHGNLSAVNLSRMPTITHEIIQKLLGPKPAISSLYLVGCPQVNMESLNSMLWNCNVYHSGLMKSTCMIGNKCPNFNLITGPTDPVAQLIYIGIRKKELKKSDFKRANGSMIWDTLVINDHIP